VRWSGGSRYASAGRQKCEGDETNGPALGHATQAANRSGKSAGSFRRRKACDPRRRGVGFLCTSLEAGALSVAENTRGSLDRCCTVRPNRTPSALWCLMDCAFRRPASLTCRSARWPVQGNVDRRLPTRL